jgi:hypothetical protein
LTQQKSKTHHEYKLINHIEQSQTPGRFCQTFMTVAASV